MWASGIVGPHTDENAERRGEVAKVVEDLVVLADEVLQREAREGMQTAHNCFGAALAAHKEAPVLQVTLCVMTG